MTTTTETGGHSLDGRHAACGMCGATQPSARALPFFEFKGEGSEASKRDCKHCHYFEVAHEKVPERCLLQGGAPCPGFESNGPYEFDRYYCGCRGWD